MLITQQFQMDKLAAIHGSINPQMLPQLLLLMAFLPRAEAALHLPLAVVQEGQAGLVLALQLILAVVEEMVALRPPAGVVGLPGQM